MKQKYTLLVLFIFSICIPVLGNNSIPVNNLQEFGQGGIKIEVVNDLGEVVVRDSYDFIEETSLYDILHDNYTVGCASSSYDLDYSCNYESFNSHIVLAIDDVETGTAQDVDTSSSMAAYSTFGCIGEIASPIFPIFALGSPFFIFVHESPPSVLL